MSYVPFTDENLTPDQRAILSSLPPSAGYGHLSDYVGRLHIITGPNGMCMCGEDGLTCGERLARVSPEIRDGFIAAIAHNDKLADGSAKNQ